MRRLLLLVVLTVVGIGLFLLLNQSESTRRSDREQQTPLGPSSHPSARAESGADGEQPENRRTHLADPSEADGAAEVAEPEPSGATRTVRVQVVEFDSQEPLAQVPLHVFVIESSKPHERTDVQGETDANGLFELQAPVDQRFSIVIVPPNPITAGIEAAFPILSDPQGVAEYRLSVPLGARLAGVVIDEHRRPVAGAKLECRTDKATDQERFGDLTSNHHDIEWTTEEDGSFRFEGLHGEVSMSIAFGDRLVIYCPWELNPGESIDDVVIQLPPMRSLAIEVFDEQNRGIEGAVVNLSPLASGKLVNRSSSASLTRYQQFADKHGRLELAALPAIEWKVQVYHRSHRTWKGSITADQSQLRVRMERGAILQGIVHDETGKPLADAEVAAWVQSPDLKHVRWSLGTDHHWRKTKTDAEGHYRFEGRDPGELLCLRARAKGHAPQVIYPWTLEAGSNTVDFALPPGLEISGQVLDKRGEPARRATVKYAGDRRVQVQGVAVAWDSLFSRYRYVSTDDEGRFAIPDLYSGEFELQVSAYGSSTVGAKRQAYSGGPDLRIQLGEGLEYSGSLRLELTGYGDHPLRSHISGSWFLLRDARGQATKRSRKFASRGVDGAFTLDNLEAGEYAIVLRAPGYAQVCRHAIRITQAQTVLALQLEPAKDLVLHFDRSTTTPETKYWLELEDAEGRYLSGTHPRAIVERQPMVIPASGTLELHELPPRLLRLRVLDQDRNPVLQDSIDLSRPNAGFLRVSLP